LQKSQNATDDPQQKPTILYLIRHTDVYNPNDILYGRLPRFGLSDLGREQAERTAQVLAEEPVAIFYTSPQLRARQTVRILSKPHPNVPVRVSSLLNEVRTSWQGKPHSELEAIRFDFYANPIGVEDERLDEIWARLQRFVRMARRRHVGQAVVGITHGDPVILARIGYLGLPIHIDSMRIPQVYPGKGSLTRFTFGPDIKETYPLSVEYYDPNGDDPRWSQDWVKLPPEGAVL